MGDFRVRIKDEDHDFRDMNRVRMLAAAAKFVGTRKARAWREGNPVPQFFRKALDVNARVRALTKLDPPNKVVIEREDGKKFVIVKVEAQAKPGEGPDLGCAPMLETMHYLLLEKFPKARSAGRFVCKFVSGTSQVSKHGYQNDPVWHGAAEDFFFESFDQQTAAFNYMIDRHQAGDCEIDMLISHDQFWTPETGKRPYSGVFHSHLHQQVAGGSPCHPSG